MSKKFEIRVPCQNCKKIFETSIYSSVNVTDNPDLKEKVFNEEIKEVVCPYCKYKTKVESQLLYHDMDNGFALYYDPLKTLDLNIYQNKGTIFDNYVFNAPVINEWSKFLAQIILFENRIQLTPRKNRLLRLIQRENLGTFYEQVKDIFDDLQMNEIKCKYCGNFLEFNSMEENCYNCGKKVREKSPYVLELALEILISFFKNFNDMFRDNKNKFDLLIDTFEKIINSFYFLKTIDRKELKKAKEILEEIKTFGIIDPPIFFFKIENNRPNITLNEYQIKIDIGKLGDFKSFAYLAGALDYFYYY